MLMPLESTIIKGELENKPTKSKVPCWCTGRHGKEHTVGEPFCLFPVTYLPPSKSKSRSDDTTRSESKTGTISADSNLREGPQLINLTKSPMTFDEELLMACINRAIMKTPSDFVTMLDEGRVNFVQARRINNELRLMGYVITEDPF